MKNFNNKLFRLFIDIKQICFLKKKYILISVLSNVLKILKLDKIMKVIKIFALKDVTQTALIVINFIPTV